MPFNISKSCFRGEHIMLSLLIFTYLFFFFTSTNAQNKEGSGLLPVYNFSPKTYGALEQNFSITQDQRGIMYFGNNQGVLEYDGVNWRLIRTSTRSAVRSLNIDKKGRIWVGSVNEFGYLLPDSLGKLIYKSLTDRLDPVYKNFKEIWNIHVTSSSVIFQAEDYLFIYDQDSLRIFQSGTTIHESFYLNDILYTYLGNTGLAYFNNDSLVMLPGGEVFPEDFIYGMAAINQSSILIATANSGLYKLQINHAENSTKILKLKTPVDKILENVEVFNLNKISDNRFSIGTWGNGVILMDTVFNLISVIDNNSGLQDLIVQGQYIDKSGNLWLALGNGISRVEINSPLSHFNDKNGILGSVQSIKRFNNTIYTATLRGLYYLVNEPSENQIEKNEQVFFKVVKGFDEMECWDILNFSYKSEEILLVVTNNNITEVDQHNRSDVVVDEVPWKLYQSKLDPARVYIGLESGLTSIYRKDNHWIDEGNIEGIDEQIISLSEDHAGNLWMGTSDQGVLKLSINSFNKEKNIDEVMISRFDSTNGLPKGPFIVSQLSGSPLIATNKGLYRFNLIENRFEPDSSYGKQFADGSHYIHRINTADSSFIWMVAASAGGEKPFHVGYFKQITDKSYEWIFTPFRKISEGLIDEIFIDSDRVVWLGGAEGLFRYDPNLKKNYSVDFNAFIRKVSQSNGEPVFEGTFFDESGLSILDQPKNLKPILPHSKNSLVFNYSAQSGEDETFLRFSYYLEGYDDNWSEWIPEPKKEYTNLYEGHYVFHVKAINIYDHESTEATYEFTILPPWYRKWWAILLYLFLATLIVYIIVKMYTRRLRQIIRIKTAQVVKQKDEIQMQKEEIEQKNNDILDSIKYAKKIQTALLPPEQDMEKLNLDGFILYMPRDIVSGDFYWIGQKNGKTITVAADCTGHGVPGAFMSMLGIAFLNNIIKEKEDFTADQILNELRKQVIIALRQKGQMGEQKEGMDIAMHIIDWENKKLEYAGAFNPLVLIRNETIFTISADRMPIGIGDMVDVPFKDNILDIVKGDVFYIYSDGYQDQFGGPRNKKFMVKRLKDLFLQISKRPMSEQKEILMDTLSDWMIAGRANQIDDIIVIGVRI